MTTSTDIQVQEGDEYRIILQPGNKVLFEGIAESDQEAEENLETQAMYVRANLNMPTTVTLKIEKM